MIGALAASRAVPLDYRCALDAALATLGDAQPLVICRADALRDEIEQRTLGRGTAGAGGGLWAEPGVSDWHADLASFARDLAPGAPLAIIASQPLARLLPERRGWRGAPLGMRAGGIGRLLGALEPAGFALSARHGFHSVAAIGLLALSSQAQRRGRPHLADQLYFAARLRYRAEGRMAGFATVALLIAKRK